VRSEARKRRRKHNAITLPPAPPHAESLRVGIFSESFAPVRNGVTISLNTLISGLRHEGHRVWVCAPAHEDQQSHETNVLRFPSFVTAYNREYPLAYPFYPRLALSTHFNRLRLDIVHTHTPFILGLTGARLAISLGTPLVSTYHTHYSEYTHYLPVVPEPMSQGLLDVYLPWYYNRCSSVICPSHTTKRTLESFGVETRIEVIPTGIPVPRGEDISQSARADIRAEYGWSYDTPILLYAGRIAEEKNIGWLLRITAQVKRTHPNIVLAIAGNGTYRSEIELLVAELGLERTVQFLGMIPREKMDSVFCAADLFCFPSETETQGLVIGEARAAGLPVVVVDSGGAPETVQEGVDGFRIAAGDTAGFVARVNTLLSSPTLMADMRVAARKRALQFAPDRMINSVLSVYEDVRTRPVVVKSLVPPIDGKALYWNIFSPR